MAAIVYGECFAESEPTIDIGAGYINPSSLTDTEFAELIEQITAGKVRALRFKARVFSDRPNANAVRPRPGTLQTIVDAGVNGARFYESHYTHSSTRLGNVESLDLGRGERRADALVTALSILDPKAQERFVRGLVARFSIG